MTNLIDSFLKNTVGYDYTFLTREQDFPKYNIIKDDTVYRIELALAGYKKEELTVKLTNGKLKISGTVAERQVDNYLYKGISSRNFFTYYEIKNSLEVTSVTFEDGMLVVTLESTAKEDKEKTFEIN